jgi:exopolyphosphatase/guanosine-5'-triphosphate,3'-diphosphate pyrophosphatase
LDWLLDRLIAAQSIENLRIPGLREDRAPIISGGLAVMRAIFQLLRIESMEMASGGLRHGLICDLLGDTGYSGDLRVNSVNRLASKFGVDTVHGQRVGRVASTLRQELFSLSNPSTDSDRERALRELHWAGELHEIGSRISHSDYHKHGAYILDNADAMGFSLSEMHRLSLMVLGHRGKLRKLGMALEDKELVQQLMCLRLAVILCHARRDPDMKGVKLIHAEPMATTTTLQCRESWATTYPQSAHLLREEGLAWEKTPWRLEIAGL